MSRRFELREYQARLTEELAGARNQRARDTRLAVRSGGRNWLVSLDEIEEVLPLPEIMPVPAARDWFLGLANVRGTLWAVSDLSAFMGQGATPRHAGNRLMLVRRTLGVNAAVLVEATLGLKNPAAFKPAGHPEAAWALERLAEPSGEDWHALGLANLVTHAAFFDVESPVPA